MKILTNPFYLSRIHLKKPIKEKYEEKISNLDDSSKLLLYSKLKTDIKLGDYLKLTKKFNNRQLLTKFRTSDHPLEIELGRYKKLVKLVKY